MTLDEATDRLYAADLGDFVAERKRLALELREAGDGTASAQVAKLKKPTLAAWGLNQLSRRRRRDVDLLLDAGHRLRQARRGSSAAPIACRSSRRRRPSATRCGA